MLIGYVRVSKNDGSQTLAPQRDALLAAGVDPGRIYQDLASGRHDARRGLGFVDQGYTGGKPAKAAAAHGIALEVVKLPEAKRGFVLLPRRWVVERSFAWAARCRRLARDYERLPTTLAGLHVVAFACPMLRNAAALVTVHDSF